MNEKMKELGNMKYGECGFDSATLKVFRINFDMGPYKRTQIATLSSSTALPGYKRAPGYTNQIHLYFCTPVLSSSTAPLGYKK